MLEDSNPQVSSVRSITRNNLTHEQLGITLQLAPLGWSENNGTPQEPRVQRVYHHLLNLFPENWPYLGRSVPHFQTNPYIYTHENNVDLYIYIYIYSTHYIIDNIVSYCILVFYPLLNPQSDYQNSHHVLNHMCQGRGFVQHYLPGEISHAAPRLCRQDAPVKTMWIGCKVFFCSAKNTPPLFWWFIPPIKIAKMMAKQLGYTPGLNMTYGGFQNGGPKSSRSLDHFLILKQPWWRLGIPHDLRTPQIWLMRETQ